MQLNAEPLTTHVVLVALQTGAARPQPLRDLIAGVLWRDSPIVQASIWLGEAGRQLLGVLPRLHDGADACPPPAEMRSAPEGLYWARGEHGPRHHFLVATDHEVELCDRTVALVADTVQCMAHHAMILPREWWEGIQ